MASLGWNTESTLLPKKAKKIAAPNTSMGALKDEVFAASMTAAAAGGKGKYARGTASRRRTDADDLDSAGRKMILTTCSACAKPIDYDAPAICAGCQTRYCSDRCERYDRRRGGHGKICGAIASKMVMNSRS